MKKHDGINKNKYDVYLLLGSLAVFLFILLPISLIYIADINIVILIMILGIFFLFYFLATVLGIFNNDLGDFENKNVTDIKFKKNLSHDVKSNGDSSFSVSFAKDVKSFHENGDGEKLYSLNMNRDDFFKK